MKSKKSGRPAPSVIYEHVVIPTNQAFLIQWHQWVHKQVAQLFRRDSDRIMDTVQQVRQRILLKDMIGRWFFKHLRDEMVDRLEAERVLGRSDLTFLGQVPMAGVPNPACLEPKCVQRRKRGLGCSRACKRSMWRVSDLLAFARFDHARYYYTAQGHTIDSDQAIRLLGYPAGSYELLSSLYRQGRLWPAEFTEHECRGRDGCPECARGRDLLRNKRLSLAHRWDDPSVKDAVGKVRWNDRQLVPFLRGWRGMNTVATTPGSVMRVSVNGKKPLDVEAGLLAYAAKFIRNTVINEFKSMTRHDDTSRMVYNGGICPALSDRETVAFDGDEPEEKPQRILCDPGSHAAFEASDRRSDVISIIERSNLSTDEFDVIVNVDLREMSVRQYAESRGRSVQAVHRARTSALEKMRLGASG